MIKKRKPKKGVESEKELCKAIAQWLALNSKLKKYIYMHIPNEYVPGPTGIGWEKHLQAMGKIKGAPDYVVAKGGRVMFIEVKTSLGKLSVAQKAFMSWCEDCGVLYRVCRSLEEVMKIVKFFIYDVLDKNEGAP